MTPRPRSVSRQLLPSLGALALFTTLVLSAPVSRTEDRAELFAKTFDTHWERLRDDYPYFELYGVDWKAERDEHRPKAVAAASDTEFAYELALLLSALPDPHVDFKPSMATMKGRWSIPEVRTKMIGRRPYVIDWAESDSAPTIPQAFADDPHAYPEIVGVEGHPAIGQAEILAAGPVGSSVTLRLRWPDDTETDWTVRRPDVANIPPPEKHFGDRWLVSGRVGSIGYMRVQTFDPSMATLGPDGKMTTMLRAALAKLHDTEALILDLQGNGGGLVAASDPFLGNLVEKRMTYKWGRSGGKVRTVWTRSPRYTGKVVAIVDERSASGGEWAARILRDAGRAKVVGGRTCGAEAAVHLSNGPDGSIVRFSAWPMVEPGRKPFQETGIEVDHFLPFTIDDARRHGYEEAFEQVRRARFAKALELLEAPAQDVDALLTLAKTGDAPEREDP